MLSKKASKKRLSRYSDPHTLDSRSDVWGSLCFLYDFWRYFSADEIGHDFGFCFRCCNASLFTGFDALQYPRHVAAKDAHDLKSFGILTDFIRRIAMYHGPVVGSDAYHLMIGQVFIEDIESSCRSGTTGGCDGCSDFVYEGRTGFSGELIHKGNDFS